MDTTIDDILLHALVKSGFDESRITKSKSSKEKDAMLLSTYIKTNSLSYHGAWRLAMCISIQLSAIELTNQTLLYILANNIVRVDEDWYLLVDIQNQLSSLENKHVVITKPLPSDILTSNLISPELKQIKELPININQSNIYYNIARVIISAMKITEPIHVSLISNSPLYYFLERCLLKKPIHRHFLLI